ncbi:hypothetical protein GCM10019016_111480 [Streptomyces prasinosporus]|uniref:NAD-glutamate dehydrogenase n=1 Tax=Streptomyces prasinosporus TaxID=68256 RepID=A0ABP6UAS1_9ACTN
MQVEEARELLRWLADDHFTFLGYREYELRDDDSLAAVPRHRPRHPALRPAARGRRGTIPVSPSFERLPADARAKAREHKLLVLTKANSRATVHRPSYLDYIGVKKFDADGNVVGERRFLGLFSSAAYTESVRRVPGDPPQGRGRPGAGRLLAAQPRRARPAADPGDLPARRALPDARPGSCSPSSPRCSTSRSAAGCGCTCARTSTGRYYSALVYLPRDRYTTGVRLRIIDILKEELGGISVDFTAWNTESVLSRLHFVVRVPQGTELRPLSDSDKERIEARLVEAARSWADGFAEALNTEFGEERAAELLRRYGGAFPEGYKADHSPRSAVADLVRLEELDEERNFALSLYEPVGAAPDERRFKIYRTTEAVSLSAVLPVLQRLGVEVVDERPYELRCDDRSVSPTSTTSACACRRRPAAGWTTSATTPASASRTPSRRPGPARRRTTASTPSC